MGHVYKQSELYDLLGPRFKDWHTASAIVMAESGGDPDATSPNPDGGTNVGLFQIDTNTARAHGLDPTKLKDPQYNAYAAKVISNGGKNWRAWETYVKGTYKKFMKGAKLPDADSAGPFGIPVNESKANPFDPQGGMFGAVTEFLGKLDVVFQGDWWLRVGKILMGIVALVLAGAMISKEFGMPMPIPLPI